MKKKILAFVSMAGVLAFLVFPLQAKAQNSKSLFKMRKIDVGNYATGKVQKDIGKIDSNQENLGNAVTAYHNQKVTVKQALGDVQQGKKALMQDKQGINKALKAGDTAKLAEYTAKYDNDKVALTAAKSNVNTQMDALHKNKAAVQQGNAEMRNDLKTLKGDLVPAIKDQLNDKKATLTSDKQLLQQGVANVKDQKTKVSQAIGDVQQGKKALMQDKQAINKAVKAGDTVKLEEVTAKYNTDLAALTTAQSNLNTQRDALQNNRGAVQDQKTVIKNDAKDVLGVKQDLYQAKTHDATFENLLIKK